ncbi:MAG: general secretion pathway protein GspB [Gammaproteobacteria bacterium]
MSLILDALRKSERTRQQTLTGQVSAADAPPVHRRFPVPWTALIGILLIVNIIVLAIIFWRSHSQVVIPATTETRMATAAPPVTQSIPAYHPEIRSLAAEAGAQNIPPVTSENAVLAAPAASPARAASTKTVPLTTTMTPTALSIVPATGASLSSENVPPLDTLPLSFQQSLPSLHLDVHSYAQNPADRFVIINMQRYQAGDTLKEGPKVIRIVPEGVILEYNGQRFLLPRT